MERNKFLVFCFAFVPGAGQMYLGMMKKGLVIHECFLGGNCQLQSCSIWSSLRILPIIWFYAFFDTFNSARYHADQRLQMDYKFWEDMKHGGWVPKMGEKFSNKTPKFLGLGCILLGLYSLYETVIAPLFWRFDLPDWIYFILNRIPSLVVACAVIGLGVIFTEPGKNTERSGRLCRVSGGAS